ncbi:putative endonuclease 4 [anaerobic digester metagenome]
MVKVGVHVSIAGSIDRAVMRALDYGCDTFQIFSRNPRGWAAKPLADEDAARFRDALGASKIGPVFDHMPYLPNLATPKDDLYERSVIGLQDELGRAAALGIPYVVTHLGHHLGAGDEAGEARVVAALDRVMEGAPASVMLLLENTAGERNSVGSRIDSIARIIGACDCKQRLGVCFDTCHAFGAGYDLRTEEGIEEVLAYFDETIGLARLRMVHCNDSKGELGSGLDRHEHVGLGAIGEEGFRLLLHRPELRDLPFICETPEDDRRDGAGNIAKVRELAA